MARYQHTFPKTRKARPQYHRLFENNEDKVRLLYNRDNRFKTFVNEWHKDLPDLLAWTLTDFYTAYTNNGHQLSFTF